LILILILILILLTLILTFWPLGMLTCWQIDKLTD
jgi:hypothetical protein